MSVEAIRADARSAVETLHGILSSLATRGEKIELLVESGETLNAYTTSLDAQARRGLMRDRRRAIHVVLFVGAMASFGLFYWAWRTH